MPEVSVIVPVYNVESYLPECLDSILAQSFRDYELILVDDGSTDKSGAICEEYAEKDGRIRVLRQSNKGQSAARNLGVAESKSKLLCFIDSDDAVNPVLLESFLSTYKRYRVGVVTCDRIQGKATPGDFYLPNEITAQVIEINEDRLLELLNNNETIYWSLFPCLIEKIIYDTYPLTNGRVMEDNAVSCQWLTESGSVALIRSPLYFYRENPNSTMNAAFTTKKLDFLWALEQQLSFYEKCGFEKMQGAVAREFILSALYLADRAGKELGDKKLSHKIVSDALRIRNRYCEYLNLTEDEERKIFKATHPLRHKIRKKLRSVKS